MSSWSGSGYPPSRGRSRSRSPYRSGYAPPRGGEPAYYPSDSYRGDWDPYERDRAWQTYERDRAAYDYGRRGRSRSPPPSEDGKHLLVERSFPLTIASTDFVVGRKRRRSASPYERERYDPRPRYDDYGEYFTIACVINGAYWNV